MDICELCGDSGERSAECRVCGCQFCEACGDVKERMCSTCLDSGSAGGRFEEEESIQEEW